MLCRKCNRISSFEKVILISIKNKQLVWVGTEDLNHLGVTGEDMITVFFLNVALEGCVVIHSNSHMISLHVMLLFRLFNAYQIHILFFSVH